MFSSHKKFYPDEVHEKHVKGFSHYLAEDETMLFFTHPSNVYLRQLFILYFALGLILPMILCLIGFYYFNFDPYLTLLLPIVIAFILASFKVFFTKEGIQFILTDKRVVVQVGYFRVTLYTAPYEMITYIQVEQTLMERLFLNYGTVIVHTASNGSKSIVLEKIHAPFEFKNILEKMIHNSQVKNNLQKDALKGVKQ